MKKLSLFGWAVLALGSMALAGCGVEPLEERDNADGLEQVTEVTQASSAGIVNPGAQNVLFSGSFSRGGQTCPFVFMYGNFGVGYTQLRLDSSGCGRSTTTVVYGGTLSRATAVAIPNGGTTQATGTANIVSAFFCVATASTGHLQFSYNAINNARGSVTEAAGGCP